MKIFLSISIVAAVIFLIASSIVAAQENPHTPTGWGTTGSNPDGYDFMVDRTNKHSGNACSSIRPNGKAVANKFGGLVQAIRPDEYRGKRIRFSGYVKTENVSENVQLWVRVDGPGMRPLDFSNMDKRSIKGTTDWQKYDLVIDVPAEAEAIVFGAFLGGTTGQAWLDDLKLETVAGDTPKTSNVFSEADRQEQEEYLKKTPKEEIEKIIAYYRALPTKPVNLDFEQAATAVGTTAKKP